MTVLGRRVASVPYRAASETWSVICDLLAPDAGPARAELDAATGVAAMLIAEEYTQDAPIIVSGTGPQVRVYTVHGTPAIEGEVDELPLSFVPTDGDWTLSLPARGDDFGAAQAGLPPGCRRITVRDADETPRTESPPGPPVGDPVIDLRELERS